MKTAADEYRDRGEKPRPVVLAFGGNALLPDPDNPDAQEENALKFARAMRLILPEKAGMALVHGNGPQVGMILLRIEATRDRIPPETLDIMVAETQGSIGYLLSRALRTCLEREVAAVLTQVLVDPDDPAFSRPDKPIGPFYSSSELEHLQSSLGWRMTEAPGRGWRRVVPSPLPREIVEMHTIADAVSHGHVVIAGGGGGIPVSMENRLRGLEAVIDKDRTAALLAVALEADRLIILTEVPHVSRGFGTPEEAPIHLMDTAMAKSLLAEGQFPPGSMGPKVESSARYAEATGHMALITDVDHLEEALRGEAGTWITPCSREASLRCAPDAEQAPAETN